MKNRTMLFIIALLFNTTAISETLEISVSKQAPGLQNVERPANGMSKDTVENRFGSPQEMMAPVGDPPISKWVYGDFTVYFEYNTVIHAVLHHPQSTDK